MTSDRKVDANRRNASRSTGPKSADGKSRVAQNAAKHGLTGGLPEDQVLEWYRLILDEADAWIDPLSQDPRARAALNLAEAQVQLQRVRRAMENLVFELSAEAKPLSPQDAKIRRQEALSAYVAQILKQKEPQPRPNEVVPREAMTSPELRPEQPSGPAFTGKRLRAFARYLSEAEARRSKALKHWAEVEKMDAAARVRVG